MNETGLFSGQNPNPVSTHHQVGIFLLEFWMTQNLQMVFQFSENCIIGKIFGRSHFFGLLFGKSSGQSCGRRNSLRTRCRSLLSWFWVWWWTFCRISRHFLGLLSQAWARISRWSKVLIGSPRLEGWKAMVFWIGTRIWMLPFWRMLWGWKCFLDILLSFGAVVEGFEYLGSSSLGERASKIVKNPAHSCEKDFFRQIFLASGSLIFL